MFVLCVHFAQSCCVCSVGWQHAAAPCPCETGTCCITDHICSRFPLPAQMSGFLACLSYQRRALLNKREKSGVPHYTVLHLCCQLHFHTWPLLAFQALCYVCVLWHQRAAWPAMHAWIRFVRAHIPFATPQLSQRSNATTTCALLSGRWWQRWCATHLCPILVTGQGPLCSRRGFGVQRKSIYSVCAFNSGLPMQLPVFTTLEPS